MKAIQLNAVQQPLEIVSVADPVPNDHEVVVKIAGCGVCHTDIGFWKDGVPTKHELPLILGHEISGTITEAGSDYSDLVGREVLIPAVIPCGTCKLCQSGRGNVCLSQIMPGNDIQGGFAEYIKVPGRGLCLIDNKGDYKLEELSVIADAVTTPYQAVVRSGLQPGDLAIVIGVGGVGGYCVQIAKALGAVVVALDVDDHKLTSARTDGADLALNSAEMTFKELKAEVKQFAKKNNFPNHGYKIFECSGHHAGQQTALGLINHAATLMVVGFTLDKVKFRLSNLMAFDATLQGTWGCKTELYPEVLNMVIGGKIVLRERIQPEAMSQGPDIIESVSKHEIDKRVILVPDWN